MNPTFDLASVIDALVRIRDAGWWPDLECAIAEASRGPRRDLDRWPHHRMTVEEVARLTARLTGLPLDVCRESACQRLLPSTRQRIALEIIAEFDARLAEQTQSAAATARLAPERTEAARVNEQLSIECSPADEKGRHLVVATLGDRSHTDRFDVDMSFLRQKWREAVIRELRLEVPWTPEGNDDDAALHAELEARLLAAAYAEDECAEQTGGGRWQPKLLCMADVEARPIRWLWPQRFALGRLSLLVGMPGAGKSFLTCDMAARISTGSPWPDGGACPKGSVLLVTAEDDPGDTIRPRLDAHYADTARVHLLAGLHRTEIDGSTVEEMYTLADIGALEATLQQLGDCRLVVIDPIGSFLGGRTDAHRDNEVRAVLAPVARLAEAYGPSVLVVAHRRKSAGTVADDMALGSRAFTGIARAVWHLSHDAGNRGRRLLLQGKSNLAAVQNGLAFTIAGEPAAIRWERDPVAMTADDALAQEQGDRGESSALGEALLWLRDALAEGPRAGEDVKAAAKRDGIAVRTLERAKAKLGVETGPAGFGAPWVWKLPGCASVRQDFPQSAKNETLADSGETVADSDGRPLLNDDDGDPQTDWIDDSF